MDIRLLADDGSVHAFPEGTDVGVMSGVVGRYNAGLAQEPGAVQLAANAPASASATPVPAPVASDLGPNSGLKPAHDGVCLPNVKQFMDAHLADARTLAGMVPTGVSPQEILALSGNESGYGDTRNAFTRNANFFGLHNAGSGPFPGQIGSYTAARNSAVHSPVFAPATGYMDSGRAFVNLEAPHFSGRNPSDPAVFFDTIHHHGYATDDTDKSYRNQMLNVYGLFGNCLGQKTQ